MPRLILTSRDLRKIAEKADGMRGKMLRLWLNPDDQKKPHLCDPEAEPCDARGGNVLIDVKTDHENKERKGRGLDRVVVSPEACIPTSPTTCTSVDDVAKHYDALFWSEAAVEKFMLPYYVRSLTREQFDCLRRAYYNNEDPDICEKAEWIPTVLPPQFALLEGRIKSLTHDDVLILGFGHLPTSDYGEIDDGTDIHKVYVITPSRAVPAPIYFFLRAQYRLAQRKAENKKHETPENGAASENAPSASITTADDRR